MSTIVEHEVFEARRKRGMYASADEIDWDAAGNIDTDAEQATAAWGVMLIIVACLLGFAGAIGLLVWGIYTAVSWFGGWM